MGNIFVSPPSSTPKSLPEGVYLRRDLQSLPTRELFTRGRQLRRGSEEEHRNNTAAMLFFKMAAERGCIESVIWMASCYRLGRGVEKDKKKAFQLIQHAAESDHTALGKAVLALCYFDGELVNRDMNMASKLAKQSVAKGLPQLAQAGNELAQSRLAIFYFEGLGVSKSLRRSVELLEKASALHDETGQTFLGFLYLHGIGVPKNASRAVNLFRLAAIADNSVARAQLGVLYLEGIGVPKNIGMGLNLLQIAADDDSGDALTSLGNLYLLGDHVPRNPFTAFTYFKRASDNGDTNGMLLLGSCYEHGIGVSRDTAEARHLFRLAAEGGHPLGKESMHKSMLREFRSLSTFSVL